MSIRVYFVNRGNWHTICHNFRKFSHSLLLFNFSLHCSFCSSLKKSSQIYWWGSRKWEDCNWNPEKEKEKEENRNVEKENVLDGTQKRKKKVENGDVEKAKEDSEGVCHAPLTCKVNVSLDGPLTVSVKW